MREQAVDGDKLSIKGQLYCFSITWFYKRDLNCACLNYYQKESLERAEAELKNKERETEATKNMIHLTAIQIRLRRDIYFIVKILQVKKNLNMDRLAGKSVGWQ